MGGPALAAASIALENKVLAALGVFPCPWSRSTCYRCVPNSDLGGGGGSRAEGTFAVPVSWVLGQSVDVLLMLLLPSDVEEAPSLPMGAFLGVQLWSPCSQAPACRWHKTDADAAAPGVGNVGAGPADMLPCSVVLHCRICEAFLSLLLLVVHNPFLLGSQIRQFWFALFAVWF